MPESGIRGTAGHWSLLASALLFFATAGAAASTLRVQRLDVSRLPEIECDVTVVSAGGDSLLGLTAAEFSVQIDGVPQKIMRLASALDHGKSLAVALLVDGSGSMKPHLRQAREAAATFISHTSRGDLIAIFSCNESLQRHLDFSLDRAAVVPALAEMQARKNTAIFDALREILVLFKNVPAERRALVVLSDGRDNRSRSTVADGIQSAKDAGITLFTVGLGPGSDDVSLRRLAEESGGEFFKAARAEDLLSLYRKIAEHLSNQYVLTFVSSFAGDGQWRELQIAYADADGSRPAAQRKFRASTGPAANPSAILSLQARTRQRRQQEQALLGALLGLLCALLLLAAIKLLRPSISLFSLFGLAFVVAFALLGAVIAVLVHL